jgi:hypothetical protein
MSFTKTRITPVFDSGLYTVSYRRIWSLIWTLDTIKSTLGRNTADQNYPIYYTLEQAYERVAQIERQGG